MSKKDEQAALAAMTELETLLLAPPRRGTAAWNSFCTNVKDLLRSSRSSLDHSHYDFRMSHLLRWEMDEQKAAAMGIRK